MRLEETRVDQEEYTTTRGKWEQLSERERYKIEALYQEGLTPLDIAVRLGRDRRTIERELARGMVEHKRMNPTTKKNAPLYIIESVYLADVGQRKHEEASARKGRGLKIGHDHKLAEYLEQKIGVERWSPDAAIGAIQAQGLTFQTSICTRTVYNMIDRGDFLHLSNKNLLVKKDGEKRRYKRVRGVALNNKKGKSIEERPEVINQREEAGHWEIDLVVGKQGTKPVILTLVERKSRKSVYVLVKNKTQKEVVEAIKQARRRVGGNFEDIFKTITADNGSEFLDSEAIKKAAKCGEVYYAHPYSSWERGSNENGNRILRRFVPKGADIGKLTAKQLQIYEDWVNNYPRRILGYKTANQAAS
jgi:IS30 family transposase